MNENRIYKQEVGPYTYKVNGSLRLEDTATGKVLSNIPLSAGRKKPSYDRMLSLVRSADDLSVNPVDIFEWFADFYTK